VPEAARPVDDQIAAQVKEMEEGLRQLQENMKSMPPDVRKDMQVAMQAVRGGRQFRGPAAIMSVA
jgi:hypothetical protein